MFRSRSKLFFSFFLFFCGVVFSKDGMGVFLGLVFGCGGLGTKKAASWEKQLLNLCLRALYRVLFAYFQHFADCLAEGVDG
ncbi:MAG: hypothetical protein RIS47_2078 [Bacteroidota bacterium]|jgi:hypothetical protein